MQPPPPAGPPAPAEPPAPAANGQAADPLAGSATRSPPLSSRPSPGLRAALLAVFLLMAALAGYGLGGPFLHGHYGYHAGEYSTRARHTLRHHDLLPSNQLGFSKPERDSYYLHHPILTHQLVTLTLGVFGERETSVRLAALLSSLGAQALLLLLILRRFGPGLAVLGGAVFALIPINIWFAPHIDPGFPSIVCVLGFFLFYLRWLDTGRFGDGGLALLCAGLSVFFEWSPYLAAVPVGVHALGVAARRRGRYALFVPLLVVAMLLPLGVHFLVVYKLDHLSEMRESYRMRSGGPTLTQYWKSILSYARSLYGTGMCAAVAAWLGVLVVRTAQRRWRPVHLVSVSFFFAVVAYVHLFRSAVLIHPYRMLYGNVMCALVVVELAEAAGALAAALAGRSPESAARARRLAAAAVGITLVLTMLRPAADALLESRQKGGVPFVGGYDPELVRVGFIKRVHELTTTADRVYMHPSLHIRKDLYFYLDRDLEYWPVGPSTVRALPPARQAHAVYVYQADALVPQERFELDALKATHPVLRIGPFEMLDLRRTGPGLTVEVLAPPPRRGPLARYWQGPYYHPQVVAPPR
ncbi:MAG: glycosyltransferase family 39 protein [Polyangia bacterium]